MSYSFLHSFLPLGESSPNLTSELLSPEFKSKMKMKIEKNRESQTANFPVYKNIGEPVGRPIGKTEQYIVNSQHIQPSAVIPIPDPPYPPPDYQPPDNGYCPPESELEDATSSWNKYWNNKQYSFLETKKNKERTCPSCKVVFSDEFCPNCG